MATMITFFRQTAFLFLFSKAVSATVDNVVLESYVGHWYQMMADVWVTSTFEIGSYCATADYRLNNDSTISLFNSQSNGEAAGPLSNVTGTAYPTDVSGELKVKFTPGDASPIPAPYWILKLGPIVNNNLYDYAIVSDNQNLSLFVLARDPANYTEYYEEEVQLFLSESFNGKLNTPVASYQGDDCHYADHPEYVDPQPSCPTVQALTDIDLQEYTRATWYIQQQQLNQYQQADDLFCVLATYDADGEFEPVSVPNFDGPVIGVYNYENKGEVNGHAQGNGTVLCAREVDTSKPGELLVAPCQLPNKLGGAYWVVSVGYTDNYMDWAVVSGGAPHVQYDDGCTTAQRYFNSGLWIFSRAQIISDEDLTAARDSLVKLGYTLSQLVDVEQEGCRYESATIKPDDRS
jgi:lipocalin